MWATKPLLLLLIVGTVVRNVDSALQSCMVNNFNEATISYAYDNGTTMDTNRARPSFYFDADSTRITQDFTIGSDNTADNYETSCKNDLRLCMATIGSLNEYVVRNALLANAVTIQMSDGDGDGVSCTINAVNLDLISDVTPSNANFGTGYLYNFPLLSVGVSTYVTSIQATVVDDNIAGLRVAYINEEDDIGAFDEGAADVTIDISTNGRVTGIDVNYNAASGGQVCGITVHFDTAQSQSQSAGCTTNTQQYTIADNYQFAGFGSFSDGTTGDFLLVPYQYQRLQPTVLYYTQELDQITATYWNPLDGGTAIWADTTSRRKEVEGASTTLTAGNSEPQTLLGNQFTVGNQVCGCVDIVIEMGGSVNSPYQYQQSSTFTAWTSGLVTVDSDFDTYTVPNANPTGDFYYSGSSYITEKYQSMCPVRSISQIGDTIDTNGLYIDGWIGTGAASSSVTLKNIDGPINEVGIHLNNAGTAIVGLKFSWNGNQIASMGDLTQDATTTLQLLSTGPTDDAKANSYLTSISARFDSNGNLVEINAVFERPTEPCYIKGEHVQDDEPSFLKTYQSLGVGLDKDADLYQIWFYAPSDFYQVKAQISGYFLNDGDVFNVFLDNPASYTRGQVHTAYFYHLQAEQSYTVSGMYGMVTAGTVDLMSRVATTNDDIKFDSANGVRMICSDDGTVEEQIEWEAIPDVYVELANSGTTITVSNFPASGVTTRSSASYQAFSASEYFHFVEDNYPSYSDFKGYPVEILLYRGDTCVVGLGLSYKTRDGSSYSQWLVGNKPDYDAAQTDRRTTLDVDGKRIKNIKVTQESFGTDGHFCISSMTFTYSDDTDSACFGDANECGSSDGLIEPPSNGGSDKYIYSIEIETDGIYIYSITAGYARIDIPKLELDSNCLFTQHIDYHYVRNTAWNKQLSLDSDFLTCNIRKEIYSSASKNPELHQDQNNADLYNMDDHITYHQSVIKSGSGSDVSTASDSTEFGGDLVITRQNDWQANLFCYYDTSGRVMSSFSTLAENPYAIAGTNEFEYQLLFYKTSSFTNAYTTGTAPVLMLNDPVYMAAQMTDANNADLYKVTAYRCWATGTEDGAQQTNYYTLSDVNGCPADSTFSWMTPTENTKDKFTFAAFAWYNGSMATTADIFIHCTIRACPEGSTEQCTRDCSNDKRARREVGQDMIETTVSSKVPLIVRRRDVDMAAGNQMVKPVGNAPRMVAGMFSLFATTIFFCLVVISYKVYKLRQNYQVLKHMDATNTQ